MMKFSLLGSVKTLLAKALWTKGYRICYARGYAFGIDIYDDLCKIRPDFIPGWIVDVGANVGTLTLAYSRKFPAAHVLALEPVSESFLHLVRNTRSLKNVVCVQTACGSQAGVAAMNILSNSEWNTLIQGKTTPEGSEQVQIARLDDLFRKHGVDFVDILKTDTEGYELEVLKGAGDYLAGKIRFIVLEVGFDPDDKRHCYFFDINAYLSKLGYRFVALYEQCRCGELAVSGFSNALYVYTGRLQLAS